MTDLEMTKLCAEAMRIPSLNDDFLYEDSEGSIRSYTPLSNDDQAMALVKQLGLTIDPEEDKPPFTWRVVVAHDGDWDKQIEAHGTDLNRAIVECVAKLQASHSTTTK